MAFPPLCATTQVHEAEAPLRVAFLNDFATVLGMYVDAIMASMMLRHATTADVIRPQTVEDII